MKSIIKNRKKIAIYICSAIFMLVPLITLQAAWAPSPIVFDQGSNVLRNSGLGVNDPIVITAGIINWILGILGLLALVLIIYGGFIWMFSRGNEEEAKKARDIIVGAVIGLLIVLSSYGIASYVFNMLLNITAD